LVRGGFFSTYENQKGNGPFDNFFIEIFGGPYVSFHGFCLVVSNISKAFWLATIEKEAT
jgi:hypothetical protein